MEENDGRGEMSRFGRRVYTQRSGGFGGMAATCGCHGAWPRRGAARSTCRRVR